MKALSVVVAVSFAVSALASSPSQTAGRSGGSKRALLIGINLYQPQGTKAEHTAGCQGGRCDLHEIKNLEGPLNDVAAIRDLLSSPKFAFDPKNIAVITNPALPPTQLPYNNLAASQTTRDGLLSVMQRYLVDLPNRGDTVVFFYAGHGSLRVNSKGTKLAIQLGDGTMSHADSTLVASDAWTGNYDIRDREMTRIFHAALDKGVKLTVLLDSCHSGSFTRGVELGKQYTERTLGYDSRDVNEEPDPRPFPSQRPENPALIFSAAQQDQSAQERLFGDTPSTEAVHGAFTIALIQALQTLPADAPASVVYRQVRATIEGKGVGDQTPSLDAPKARLEQPLFGGEKSDTGKTRAAVIGVDDNGRVLMDAGQLSGIDVGSEFTWPPEGQQGRPIKLRVESLQGLTLAMAKVVLPIDAKITVGQVFELSKWVPQAIDTLHFWAWPANLPQASVQAAAEQIKSSGLKIVEDPVEQPWTDMLAWNGTEWELRHAGASTDTVIGRVLNADALQAARQQYSQFCVYESLSADEKQVVDSVQSPNASSSSKRDECHTSLYKQNDGWVIHHVEQAEIKSIGASLTAAGLRKQLSPDAKLWANLPPPQELYAKLTLHESNSLVGEVRDVAMADYLLAGSLTEDGPQWAWFHKPEYLAGPRTVVSKDHSPGCSTQSRYPVSSDWVLIPDAASLQDASVVLNKYSSLLAKVNGWLNISSSLAGGSGTDYYKLAFKRADNNSWLADGQAAVQDEHLKMYLTSADRVIEKRWVYVLDINCHGQGELLYPRDNSDNNRFPNDAGSPLELELPGAPKITVGEPYGQDTVLLISTEEPLPDPFTLKFEGVGQRATRGGESPLQQLLGGTSAGTRGLIPTLPTNWSIDAYSVQSIPKATK